MRKFIPKILQYIIEFFFAVSVLSITIMGYIICFVPFLKKEQFLHAPAWIVYFFTKYIARIRCDYPTFPKHTIFAPLHHTLTETALLFYHYNPIFVIKADALFYPFFGFFFYHCPSAIIVRRDRMTFNALHSLIEERSQDGRPIMLFPEGTRTLPNQPTKCKALTYTLLRSLPHKTLVPLIHNWRDFASAKRITFHATGYCTMYTLPPMKYQGERGRDFLENLNDLFNKEKKKCYHQ
ncbi:MAG: 1-acyl-sn-glycerol-3-phosphate acyltransferase [Alphaproteobacteria bacterium]|nr:1-acyl-sn-glycerol-3-phosphate acyltransferase [Alphaproteobacteria bacterium]